MGKIEKRDRGRQLERNWSHWGERRMGLEWKPTVSFGEGEYDCFSSLLAGGLRKALRERRCELDGVRWPT